LATLGELFILNRYECLKLAVVDIHQFFSPSCGLGVSFNDGSTAQTSVSLKANAPASLPAYSGSGATAKDSNPVQITSPVDSSALTKDPAEFSYIPTGYTHYTTKTTTTEGLFTDASGTTAYTGSEIS
jgi:hypothetical protein